MKNLMLKKMKDRMWQEHYKEALGDSLIFADLDGPHDAVISVGSFADPFLADVVLFVEDASGTAGAGIRLSPVYARKVAQALFDAATRCEVAEESAG